MKLFDLLYHCIDGTTYTVILGTRVEWKMGKKWKKGYARKNYEQRARQNQGQISADKIVVKW
jgi:hypothetical protein